jgi:hypothetical protein
MHSPIRSTICSTLACWAAVALLASSGCVLFNKNLAQQFLDYQERIATSRQMIFAIICLMLIPIAVWAGLVWGTKKLTLRSWWLLLTIECILLAIFAAVKTYFIFA